VTTYWKKTAWSPVLYASQARDQEEETMDDNQHKDMTVEGDGPEVQAQGFRSSAEQLQGEQERKRRGVEQRDDSVPEVEAQRKRR
jgi:hypothetical protein